MNEEENPCKLCLHGMCSDICRECPHYYGIDPSEEGWELELKALIKENEWERRVLR